MWGTVTFNSHTGTGHHTIPQWSHTRCKYNDPSMFQTPYGRRLPTQQRRRRLHRLPPFKMGIPITILLSLSTNGYNFYRIQRQTQRIDVSRMTTRFMTIDNPSDNDDDDKHKTQIIQEPPNRLYHGRSTKVEGIVTENTIHAITENKIWYNTASAKITDVATYMETFRHVEFDNWGRTYDEMKMGMYSFKSQYFIKELKTNDRIYESACGIGMNLYMTLEILEEISDIHNITIYGNDYASKSVEIAKELYSSNHNGTFNYRLPSSFGRLGYIYEADSTQLDMVPSNSFDLVYTGYISPLKTDTQTNALLSFALADQIQQLQNDWYGKWVGEMIRIAKPGAPIIVEQVSYPRNDAKFDWGGVAPTFWNDAIQTYNWDINRSSIEMEADTVFRKRYHVFMRKNPSPSSPSKSNT